VTSPPPPLSPFVFVFHRRFANTATSDPLPPRAFRKKDKRTAMSPIFFFLFFFFSSFPPFRTLSYSSWERVGWKGRRPLLFFASGAIALFPFPFLFRGCATMRSQDVQPGPLLFLPGGLWQAVFRRCRYPSSLSLLIAAWNPCSPMSTKKKFRVAPFFPPFLLQNTPFFPSFSSRVIEEHPFPGLIPPHFPARYVMGGRVPFLVPAKASQLLSEARTGDGSAAHSPPLPLFPSGCVSPLLTSTVCVFFVRRLG